MTKADDHKRFAIRDAWNLSAPHTWPASIFPVLLAISLAYSQGFQISIVSCIVLLAISICLQSSVNSLNDYFDFTKGNDSADDNLESDDSVLISKNIDPKCALYLSIGLIVASLALGLYCIYIAGLVPLLIAAIGILVVALYSGGHTPISYLPIGEIVSGIVMGMLITFASSIVLTKTVDWIVTLWSLPEVIGIALIMMTNNTCDIEKDKKAGRRTLPSIIGRKASKRLYHALIICWYASITIITAIWFLQGIIICLFAIVGSYPVAKALFANPLAQASRIQAMSQICSMNIVLGAFYCLAIAFNGASITLF